jgi:hypothetical protein
MTALAAHAQGDAPKVDGEIRKVDTSTGKLTIRHAEIPNLQMGGMTMVFKAAPEIWRGHARVKDQLHCRPRRWCVDGDLAGRKALTTTAAPGRSTISSSRRPSCGRLGGIIGVRFIHP